MHRWYYAFIQWKIKMVTVQAQLCRQLEYMLVSSCNCLQSNAMSSCAVQTNLIVVLMMVINDQPFSAVISPIIMSLSSSGLQWWPVTSDQCSHSHVPGRTQLSKYNITDVVAVAVALPSILVFWEKILSKDTNLDTSCICLGAVNNSCKICWIFKIEMGS